MHPLEKNVCLLLCWVSVLCMSVKSSWFVASKSCKQCSYMIKFLFFNMSFCLWFGELTGEEEIVADLQMRRDGAWTGRGGGRKARE